MRICRVAACPTTIRRWVETHPTAAYIDHFGDINEMVFDVMSAVEAGFFPFLIGLRGYNEATNLQAVRVVHVFALCSAR